jgi:MFS family permease
MLVAAAMGLTIAAIGWQSSTAAYAGVVAAVTIAVFLLLGGAPRPRARAVEGGSRAGKGNTRAFALLATIHVIDSACRTGFLTFVPFLLIAKGASVASIGLALAVIFVGGAAGKLVCGLVAERVGIVRTVVLTELATGLAIGLTLVAPLLATLAILFPLGVALNGTSSVLYGTVAEFVAEDRQSRSFGLFYALGSAAGASAPPLLGVVGDLLGLTQALLVVALLALVTVPLALGLHPHLTLAERPRAPA